MLTCFESARVSFSRRYSRSLRRGLRFRLTAAGYPLGHLGPFEWRNYCLWSARSGLCPPVGGRPASLPELVPPFAGLPRLRRLGRIGEPNEVAAAVEFLGSLRDLRPLSLLPRAHSHRRRPSPLNYPDRLAAAFSRGNSHGLGEPVHPHFASSAISQALAIFQSRITLCPEIFRTSALSSTVRPPKKEAEPPTLIALGGCPRLVSRPDSPANPDAAPPAWMLMSPSVVTRRTQVSMVFRALLCI